MIELLARLFIRNSRHTDDPRVRTAYGMLCSAVAITLNILLAAAKFVVGTLAGSVSITADAMNNLSDVGSGALTLVGFRLSGKKPDLEHPFGHGRIEYVMGLVIAGIILYAGIDALRGAAGKLLHPEAMEFTWAAVAVLVLSILVKIYMSVFYRRIGRKIGSTAMEMSGADALNDTISTALTLVCLLVYKFTGLDLDAYAGIVVAVLLLKTGYEGGKETLGQLLGQRPSAELAEKVRQIVLSYPEVLAIHDLVIHDYGPGRCHVSLHAEVDGEGNIYELHEAIDRAMSELDHKLGWRRCARKRCSFCGASIPCSACTISAWCRESTGRISSLTCSCRSGISSRTRTCAKPSAPPWRSATRTAGASSRSINPIHTANFAAGRTKPRILYALRR